MMKNIIKLSQVVILVFLWGAAVAQNRPVNTLGAAGKAETADPGSLNTTVLIPPQTENPLSVLYNNGPVMNSPGTHADGADESVVTPGLVNSGFGCQYALGLSVADDFIVPPGENWSVSSFSFYTYQTGSTTTSTITGVYVAVWNGKPGTPGATVVWGDWVTNRLASSAFSNIYRVGSVNGLSSRPLMKVEANTPGLTFTTGSYWVEWALTGTLTSGPWCPPLVPGALNTGNAVQTQDGITYYDLLDSSYPQGLPFLVNGTILSQIPTLSEWGLILLGLTLLGFGTFYILRMGRA